MVKPLNILCAYPYLKPDVISYLQKFDRDYPNVLCLFVDSGAFTAFNTGKTITLDEYCKFIDALPFKPWRYILLDVIGNDVATKQNYLEMLDRGFDPVPVFTHGTDWSDVDYYYDRSDFICYGGLVGKKGSAQVINDIAKFMNYTKGRNAHLLGYTSIKYLKKFRPYSCDSSSWNSSLRYGNLMVYMGNGVMQSLDRKTFAANPNQNVKDRIKLMGCDLAKLKLKEGWVGGDSELGAVGAASWVNLSIDVEKNLGTKLFLACAGLWQVELVCKSYLKVTGLKK